VIPAHTLMRLGARWWRSGLLQSGHCASLFCGDPHLEHFLDF